MPHVRTCSDAESVKAESPPRVDPPTRRATGMRSLTRIIIFGYIFNLRVRLTIIVYMARFKLRRRGALELHDELQTSRIIININCLHQPSGSNLNRVSRFTDLSQLAFRVSQ